MTNLISGAPRGELAPKEARAYCEGMAARQAGAGSNPYDQATELDIYNAWQAGVDYAATQTELTRNNNQGCLVTGAVPVAATVPDVVGLTAAEADAAITGANLVVGTVTGTVDPVASQDPAAGVVVAEGSAVDYALTS